MRTWNKKEKKKAQIACPQVPTAPYANQESFQNKDKSSPPEIM
jgi:hypothetical protein